MQFDLKNLICPITQMYFREPVLTNTNQVYERMGLEKWLKNHNTCPFTRGIITKYEPCIKTLNLLKEHKSKIPNEEIFRLFFNFNTYCNLEDKYVESYIFESEYSFYDMMNLRKVCHQRHALFFVKYSSTQLNLVNIIDFFIKHHINLNDIYIKEHMKENYFGKHEYTIEYLTQNLQSCSFGLYLFFIKNLNEKITFEKVLKFLYRNNLHLNYNSLNRLTNSGMKFYCSDIKQLTINRLYNNLQWYENNFKIHDKENLKLKVCIDSIFPLIFICQTDKRTKYQDKITYEDNWELTRVKNSYKKIYKKKVVYSCLKFYLSLIPLEFWCVIFDKHNRSILTVILDAIDNLPSIEFNCIKFLDWLLEHDFKIHKEYYYLDCVENLYVYDTNSKICKFNRDTSEISNDDEFMYWPEKECTKRKFGTSTKYERYSHKNTRKQKKRPFLLNIMIISKYLYL